MTRGHRPSSRNTTTASPGNTAATSSSNTNCFQQQQTPRRGNRTLGWYLGEKLNGNSANANEGNGGAKDFSSASNGQMPPQNRSGISHQQQRRRGSLAETAALNCSKTSGKSAGELQQQNNTKMGKRHVQQQLQKQSVTNTNSHRPRANSSSTNTGGKKAGSATPTPTNGQSGTASVSTNDSSAVTAQQRIGKGANSGKEDYWYYDENSDGFYYEHNGTRGWRKRRPEWGTVEQMKGMRGTEQNSANGGAEQQRMALLQQQQMQKQKALEAKTSNAPCVGVPSLMAPQQLNRLAAQHLPHDQLLSPTPAHFKYYDATTDGYYYEMASFDGWKRRQPKQSDVSAADGTPPPHGTLSSSSSYCSPLLSGNYGGDQQAKMTPASAQQQWQCTSPMPNFQKQQAPHRKVQPLHYQAYQQPAPQLNPAEMQEMILLAQQKQHLVRSAVPPAVPSSCCAQLSCSQNSAGSGAVACCCSNIATMPAQLVMKQQQNLAEQKHCHQQNNFTDINSKSASNGELAAEANKLSSTDNIRSLLDMDTKLSLVDNFVMDGLNRQTVVRPTTVRTDYNQPQQQHVGDVNGATNLKLPCNKWDNHQLGGFVPSHPPLLPTLQRDSERRSSCNLISSVITPNGNTPNTTTKTTTALSIGSFEEPYEFYWSGDEAGSEVTPLGTADCGNQQENEQTTTDTKSGDQRQHSMEVPPFTLSTATTTAASVSSVEEDDMEGYGMLDQYMAGVKETVPNSEKQRKIAPIGSEANFLGNGSKKRPNELKLTCQKSLAIVSNGSKTLSTAYEPISPGEILRDDEQQLVYNINDRKECVVDSSGGVSCLPYQFNVDKFIEDMILPSSSQQQSLYTPNSDLNNGLFTSAQHPPTADSPLFTPIVPSIGRYGVKDPWYYGKGNDLSHSTVQPLQQHQQLMDGTNTWAYP